MVLIESATTLKLAAESLYSFRTYCLQVGDLQWASIASMYKSPIHHFPAYSTPSVIMETSTKLTPPIHCLPPETLCQIFTILMEDSCRISGIRKAEHLNAITSVCKYWRHTAVENAVFWTKIEIRDEAPVEFDSAMGYLSRSKGAPVDVKICNLKLATYTQTLQLNHWLN